jgi:hypothetical protein
MGGDDLAALVGMASEPFTLVVERGKIREFARATYAEHPGYLADAAPVIPPTFLMTAAHWAAHELTLLDRIPGDPGRRLHGEQEFEFPGPPPRAGTRLHGQTRLDNAFERTGRRGGRLRFYVLLTEYRDDAGDVVARARMTVVETEHAPEAA